MYFEQSRLRKHNALSNTERKIADANLLVILCEELKQIIKSNYKEYFQTLKISNKKEDYMIEANFIRCIVNDILSTEDYTLSGIAYYTNTPEDVILDIASGQNATPTLWLSQKIIKLHQTVRPELYNRILEKIVSGECCVAF